MNLRLLFLIFLLSVTPAHSRSLQYPAGTSRSWSSVLSEGRWYKIKIYHDGIYKLTFEDIREMGFTDPSAMRIFGNGGSMLPLMNSSPRPDDLVENTLYMFTGEDGLFNQGDYMLFYGKGPVTWTFNDASGMFEHQMNLYSNASYYFITTDAGIGKKVASATEVTGAHNASTNTFDDYDFHEKTRYNFLKSGRQWFGERIDYSPFDTSFHFTGMINSAPVKLKANVLSRSALSRTFIFKNDGSLSVQLLFRE